MKSSPAQLTLLLIHWITLNCLRMILRCMDKVSFRTSEVLLVPTNNKISRHLVLLWVMYLKLPLT